ncbi:MAG: hypothetical protein M3Y48_17120 [Actinomycetota bacterium]|nr:hypothetical protein [Actinomycetota bacterium]
MWGDEVPTTAINALQGYVASLRKVLEPGRARGARGEVLLSQSSGYLLRVTDGDVDIRRFERFVHEGHEALTVDRRSLRLCCGRVSRCGERHHCPTSASIASYPVRSPGWKSCAYPQCKLGSKLTSLWVGPPIIMVILLSVVGWVCWRRQPLRLVCSTASAGTGQDPSQVPATPPIWDSPVSDVRALATDALCWQWRCSYGALMRVTGPRVAHHIVAWRQACLDELCHRDPDGVRRWLDTGARAGSDPTRFLHAATTAQRADELDGRQP